VAAAGYYGVLGEQLAAAGSAAGRAAAEERPPAWIPVFELVKTFVLALVVAGLVEAIDVGSWTRAVPLALALWIGFPVVLLAGSVVHEKVPVRLAAIHAGDWLAKLLIVAIIVGAWR
jgi:hypothetical protein